MLAETTSNRIDPFAGSDLGPRPALMQSPPLIHNVPSVLEINEAFPGLTQFEPTAILIDSNNLYRRASNHGFYIDYKKLRTIFDQRCNLRYCGVFTAVDRSSPGSGNWVTLMAKNGYDTITKDLKRYTVDGESVSKGNMDVEFTIEALRLSEAFAHIILGTCDGDFEPLVHRLKEGKYRKVSVLGIADNTGSGMSKSLMRAGDNFYNLNDIRQHIELDQSRRNLRDS